MDHADFAPQMSHKAKGLPFYRRLTHHLVLTTRQSLSGQYRRATP
jgi:hypothetical protein